MIIPCFPTRWHCGVSTGRLIFSAPSHRNTALSFQLIKCNHLQEAAAARAKTNHIAYSIDLWATDRNNLCDMSATHCSQCSASSAIQLLSANCRISKTYCFDADCSRKAMLRYPQITLALIQPPSEPEIVYKEFYWSMNSAEGFWNARVM